MPFAQVIEYNPFLLCTCGHPADQHLEWGKHLCSQPGCACRGFELDATLENVLRLVRGPNAEDI
jgi:hypothetical protein